MSGLADVEIRTEGAVSVLRFRGELDFSTASELEDRVRDAVRDAAAVLVDLTGVTFVDSAGVRLLDHVVADLGTRTPWLVATADPGTVRFTLALCGFPVERLVAAPEAGLDALREQVGDVTGCDPSADSSADSSSKEW